MTNSGAQDVVARLRASFDSGRTKPMSWRLSQLRAIIDLITDHEDDLASALRADLGRGAVEAWLADLAPIAAEAKHAIKQLHSWTGPVRVRVPMAVRPGRAWYQYEPLGVTLLIGPWNYPIHLLLAPLVGAVAAGNCAILKPSERTPACSSLLADLVPRYLDPDAVAVVEGGAEATQELLAQGLDHCLFTGSAEAGKAVLAGAARHLTPVTLELGGKSPAIVTADADLSVAARRIAFGKVLNSGQTCVAPDYVLVEQAVAERFLAELTGALGALCPEPTLPLLDARHARRLAELVRTAGGRIVLGGAIDAEPSRGQLTVIVDPDLDSALMQEEIFGPVLPLITVDSLDGAICHVRHGPEPLAVYLFSRSRQAESRVLDELRNGATVINHLVYHLLVNELPFGGVGASGMGAYHGKWGFETFSHRKAVLRKPTRVDPWFAYPPYGRIKRTILRKLL